MSFSAASFSSPSPLSSPLQTHQARQSSPQRHSSSSIQASRFDELEDGAPPRRAVARGASRGTPADQELPGVRSLDRITTAIQQVPLLDGADFAKGAKAPHSWFCIGPHEKAAPRLLDRQATFKQSVGRMNIRRLNRNVWLRFTDTFHTLVDCSTVKIIATVSLIIICSWLVFAWLFLAVSEQCDLQANTFLRSLYLAIETLETIGFGVPDPFFNDCRAGVIVLGAAGICGPVLNAVVISVVYTRISRATGRASSVWFSDKAVVCQIDGHNYLMFQVCDCRKHQLVEAHVRLYCVQHTDTATEVAFQLRAMRLQHPDDTLSAMLLPVLPQVVVHRIDKGSPLCSSSLQKRGSTSACGSAPCRFPEVIRRDADSDYGTAAGVPQDIGQIAAQLGTRQLEVMCFVEGTDPLTSGTLQARHSYTCDDIVFNASFAQCVTRAADGACEIDFDLFHDVVENCVGDMSPQSVS